MIDKLSIEKIEKSLDDQGYFVYIQDLKNLDEILRISISLCVNEKYARGASYRTSFAQLDPKLKSVVYNEIVSEIFANGPPRSRSPKDVFITHEVNSEAVTINNYLHFDRLRSFKMLVYLTDVCEASGPFVVCPGTHMIGAKLRRAFKDTLSYEDKKNRIKIDYPDLEYVDELPIVGPPGTTILFNSDAFHKGGDVSPGKSRMVIRSHWYRDINWRISS